MAEQDSLPMYIKKRPLDFDPNHILAYLDTLDKRSIEAEIAYDEAKDQVQEVFDYVVNEKQTNANASVAQAKVKATNDERYKKVKKELSNRKKWHLVCKIEAKNAHSYCEGLKQKSINELAISKLTKN
jgi:hypothetical protein